MTTLEHKKDSGFVALITAIILSFILILVTTTLSQNSFLTRSILLDSEYKERSVALAEACFDIARLKLANNRDYILVTPDDTNISVGGNICSIYSLSPNILPRSFPITIRTQGVINDIYTNLEVEINSDYDIISWTEVVSF